MQRVHVSGSEWPGTEWDLRGIWYPGTIVREGDESVYVTFDGENEELEFTRESLDTYREQYNTFKFDSLVHAASLVVLADM